MAFVRAERVPEITNPEKHVPFAPDLAVEVLSPNDRSDEVEEKIQEWLAAGSRTVWTVDPIGKTVTVHSPGCRARHPHRESKPRGRRCPSGLRLPGRTTLRLTLSPYIDSTDFLPHEQPN